MVKPSTTTESTNHVVFIETSLGTELCVTITNNDTVSNLEQKITSDHLYWFPMHGKIDLNVIKVKRKKCLYHLSNSMWTMPVKSLFKEVEEPWPFYVECVGEKKTDDVSTNIREKSAVTPSEEIDFEASLDTKDIANSRKRPSKISDGENKKKENKMMLSLA